jgi:predicted AAA+ superfamily ATPase
MYVFFDEIQEVDSWEVCVNSLRATRAVDIYLTGSNSHLLSGELATYLTGRYVSFTIYPFSFAEFVALRAIRRKAETSGESAVREDAEPFIRDAFTAYLEQGGVPFVVDLDMPPTAARRYLSDLSARNA